MVSNKKVELTGWEREYIANCIKQTLEESEMFDGEPDYLEPYEKLLKKLAPEATPDCGCPDCAGPNSGNITLIPVKRVKKEYKYTSGAVVKLYTDGKADVVKGGKLYESLEPDKAFALARGG